MYIKPYRMIIANKWVQKFVCFHSIFCGFFPNKIWVIQIDWTFFFHCVIVPVCVFCSIRCSVMFNAHCLTSNEKERKTKKKLHSILLFLVRAVQRFSHCESCTCVGKCFKLFQYQNDNFPMFFEMTMTFFIVLFHNKQITTKFSFYDEMKTKENESKKEKKTHSYTHV